MEQVFETLETSDIYITTTSYTNMVKPIFSWNFQNTFHHHNGPNQIYHKQKQAGFHNQSRYYRQSIKLSPPYLKDTYQCFGFNNQK